jgi:hypothetical protein
MACAVATMLVGCRTLPFDELAALPMVDAGVAAIAPVDLARFAPVDLARRPRDLAPVRDLALDGAPDLAVDGGADAACPAADVPSRQTVTFRLHNRAGADRLASRPATPTRSHGTRARSPFAPPPTMARCTAGPAWASSRS